MEQMISLSSQNPLSLLMNFGMMAWNSTCGSDNCSGHGECHNGTCLCEVSIIKNYLNNKVLYSTINNVYIINLLLSSLILDSIRWYRMPCAKFQLFYRFCNNVFCIGIYLSDTINNVYCR